MWCILVYSPLWSQPSDFCHSTAFQFCLLCRSLLMRQSNFLSLLYHSSSYISLLSPRCYRSKNGREINPELRRPQILSFTTFTGYRVWMHLNASHRENMLKGARAISQRCHFHIPLLWGIPGVTMGCTGKPVIQILHLCFLPPFSFTPHPCGHCSVLFCL